MFLLSSSLLMFACNGADPGTPGPDPAPDGTAPAAPAPTEPVAPAPALTPIEVTLEDNQRTCFGDADCVPVELDCCCGGKVVAANKGSAAAVKKKHTRPAAQCAGTTCQEACPESTAKCVEFKCALK